MKLYILLACLTGVSFAAAAGKTLPDTPTCVYSANPTATAFAAHMPNKRLTRQAIFSIFTNLDYMCVGGSNFTAEIMKEVADVDAATPASSSSSHWFGGNKYSSNPAGHCDADSFADLVKFAMAYKNGDYSHDVRCTRFEAGETDLFSTTAQEYFDLIL